MSTVLRTPYPFHALLVVRRARLAPVVALVALAACLEPSGPLPTDPSGDDPGIRLVEQDTMPVPLRDGCPAEDEVSASDRLALGLPGVCRLADDTGADGGVPPTYRRLCSCLVR